MKFVVSCCPYCNLRRYFRFFCSFNYLSKGGFNANHIVTCLHSLAENDSRLLKNSKGNRNGKRIFCWRKEADVALFLEVTRIRKIRKICKANLNSRVLPETGWSQSNETWNMTQTKQMENPPITNHKPGPFELVEVNMCFLRGLVRWLKEPKKPKFLWIFQNAQRNTMNFAVTCA